jgi:acyl transferase domain-containing protein
MKDPSMPVSQGHGIAIIGMSGRFPCARNVDEFWRNLAAGVDAIRPPRAEDQTSTRLGPDILRHPDYVGSRYYLDHEKLFDAEIFGFTGAEAAITGPQHRVFMECAWEALESAGYLSKTSKLRVGLYAGASLSHDQRPIGNDRDYLTTHVSYKLNLRGPSIGVQTACSTSLVAVWLAFQQLNSYECDLALAGGVTVKHAAHKYLGYIYEEGNILSPDGHCRPFDASGGGTAFGSGAGVVLLKRLEEAVAERDTILAVIKEAAVNNDGAVKIGFTAPSLEGQVEVVALAQATAGVHPESIGYIEAHGTGTSLGDPVEIAALTQVFRRKTQKRGFCAIGSVKSNVGHLESAAGVTGLIKTVLALEHKQIPPSLHFQSPNPEIDFAASPFYVNTKLQEWKNGAGPRRAGVSSFGIGGTNAHVILEEAPSAASVRPGVMRRPYHILTLSALEAKPLRELAGRYTDLLASGPEVDSVCFTSNTGRRHFKQRLAAVVTSTAELQEELAAFAEEKESANVLTGEVLGEAAPKVAFLFTGQGSQYAGMGRELYETQPVFRGVLDQCASIFEPLLEKPLLEVLYGCDSERLLHETAYTQPALFAVEYALAKLWESWGIRPAALLGHSIGEYVAACVAGVFGLEDGLKLVAMRGRLMQALPAGGGMVAVFAEEDRVRAALAGAGGEVCVAAVNGPQHTVVSGRSERLEAALAPLAAEGVRLEKLTVSHAFHSPLMEPMVAEFRRILARVEFRRPKIPMISNVTGEFADAGIATAEYWVEQVLRPVQFAAGMRRLGGGDYGAWLEIGPHPVLLGMGRQCVTENENENEHQHENENGKLWLASLRRGALEWRQMLLTLGRMYVAGAGVNWEGFDEPYKPRRITQPTYPFQRKPYWAEEPEREKGHGIVPGVLEEDSKVHPLLGRRIQLAGSPQTDMEENLARIWCDLLRLDNVGVHDNFFDLGGHSLLATKLGERIEKAFGRTFPLAALFQAPTIQHLASLLSEQRNLEVIPGIVPIQPVGSRPPFFCLGAGPLFWPLAQRLGPDQPFLGLGLGEEDLRNLPVRLKLEDMAAVLARKIRGIQPAGPYFLGGWCMDGVLAYETARQLLAQDETVALLVLFDAQNPNPIASPQTPNSKGSEWRRLLRRMRHYHFKNLHRLTMPQRLDYLRDRLRTGATLLKHASWEISYKLRLHATKNFKWRPGIFDSMEYFAVRHYRPQTYPGPVLLIQPNPPLEALSIDPELGWGYIVPRGLEIYSATGGHRGMFQEPHLDTLAAKLSARLVEAQARCTTSPPAVLR